MRCTAEEDPDPADAEAPEMDAAAAEWKLGETADEEWMEPMDADAVEMLAMI